MLTESSCYDFSGNVDRGQVKLNWTWSVAQCSCVVGDSGPGPSWWAWWWRSACSSRPCRSEAPGGSRLRSPRPPRKRPQKPRPAGAGRDTPRTSSASFRRAAHGKSERSKRLLKHTLAVVAEGPCSTSLLPTAKPSCRFTNASSLSITTQLSLLKEGSLLARGRGCYTKVIWALGICSFACLLGKQKKTLAYPRRTCAG